MSKKHPVYVDRNCLSPEQGRLLQEMNRCVILVEGDPHKCVLDNIKTLRDEFAIAFMSSGVANVQKAFTQADLALKERSKDA